MVWSTLATVCPVGEYQSGSNGRSSDIFFLPRRWEMTEHDARTLALSLMARHGVDFDFSFDNALRRCGSCRVKAGRRGVITLSRHFVRLNDEGVVRNTILHELAHALVGLGHGHDAAWRMKALELGCDGEVCSGAAVAEGKWAATCPGCSERHTRVRRPKQLTGWHCKKCGPSRGKLTFALG